MKLTRKWIVNAGLMLAIAIVVIATALYFFNFFGPLSSKQADWGTFGDYLNPFIALLNVAAFVYLTYVIQKQQAALERRKMILPFLAKAMKEMAQIERKAREMIKQAPPKGTFNTFKDRFAEFESMYMDYLEEAGIKTEQLRLLFAQLAKVEITPASKPFSGTWEDKIPTDAVELLRSLANMMRNKIKLMGNFVMY